jgi:hypothetical protein
VENATEGRGKEGGRVIDNTHNLSNGEGTMLSKPGDRLKRRSNFYSVFHITQKAYLSGI